MARPTQKTSAAKTARATRSEIRFEGHAATRDEIAESGETAISVEAAAEQEVRDDLTFLAREFLTWLVWHADLEGGAFEGDAHVAPFAVAVGGKLTLRAPGGTVSDVTMKGSAPASSADLRYALAGGLAVKEVELVMERDERTWKFGLAAEHLDLKRVKLPAILDDDGDAKGPVAKEERQAAQLDDRLALLEELDAAVKHAFGRFLEVRQDAAWTRKVVPAIRRWLEEGTKA